MGDHTVQASDDSPNETKVPTKRSRRARGKVNYDQNDFDFTNLTMRQETRLETPDSSPNASGAQSRRGAGSNLPDMMEDFEGLSPVAHAITGDGSFDETKKVGKRSKVSKKKIDPAEFSDLTLQPVGGEGSRTDGDSMEQTKMPRRKRIERNQVDTVDFSNLTLAQEGNSTESTLGNNSERTLEADKSENTLTGNNSKQMSKTRADGTVYEGSMEETRVQPRRRTKKSAEVDAADFTNISYQAEQTSTLGQMKTLGKTGSDSNMVVEEPSVAVAPDQTVLGGSMEETRVQRRSRGQLKSAVVDVADFDDITVGAVTMGETSPQSDSPLKSGQAGRIAESEKLIADNREEQDGGGVDEELLDNSVAVGVHVAEGEEIDQAASGHASHNAKERNFSEEGVDEEVVEKEESKRSRGARNPDMATVARSPCLSNIGEESEETGSRQPSRASSRPPSGDMLLPDLKEVSGSPDNVITLRHARRSIYEAGQPEVPLEGSLSLGESRAEYPAGESTRLGAARSPQEQYSASRLKSTFAPIVNSPSGAARQSAHSPSARVQNSLGRSLQEGRLEDRVDVQRVSQSMMQIAKGKGTIERARSEVKDFKTQV